ncbi:MAG: PepSY domain-containing protein [Bryobacterales bacterium]|nr:PepSY domain-containing protein [Bryobacterales bacterium]
MALFRKILFWSHLITGATAGIIILIMSVTGVLLTYEKQMIAWSDRDFRVAVPETGRSPMPAGALLSAVAGQRDGRPDSITWESDPAAPVLLGFGREQMFANPYTGKIVGEPTKGMRAFMSDMRAWHRWLAGTGENRAIGKAITGASNVVFLFLVASGIYLWMPRGWSWNKLRPIVLFRGGLRGKARDFNWHNVAGFWMAIPLFIVVFSAIPISYSGFSQFMIELADGKQPAPAQRQGPPAQRGPGGPGGPAGDSSPKKVIPWSEADFAALDGTFLKAYAEPDWQTLSLRVPPKPGAPLTASVSRGGGGQPQLRETLTLQSGAGGEGAVSAAAIVKREGFADQSLGRRIRTWMRFVHTGEYYGFAGQTLAGIASAAGVLLVYSGFALTIRRFLAWNRRRRAQPVEVRAKAA